VLVYRDELISLLKSLAREESASARGFYLTAWGGQSGYTFDRIIRGKTHIDAACVSVLGSTPPGPLTEYMHAAVTGSAGDDGMIQRFSLLVWPDQNSEWQNVDRYPASEPRAKAWETFERLNDLTAEAVGAQTDDSAKIPFLRFDDEAQEHFNEWRAGLEKNLRSGDLPPALESHFAKYRKTVPSLALINHLANEGSGPINAEAMLRALALIEYLESHAYRAYGTGAHVGAAAAKAIFRRIKKGDLRDGFTARDIYRRQWSALTNPTDTEAGLSILVTIGWLVPATNETGGRPTTSYSINPKAMHD
jgi:hypothetical protein